MAYSIVLPINQPRRLVLQRCTKIVDQHILPPLSSMPPGVMPDICSFDNFSWHPLRFHDWETANLVNADDIMVLTDVVPRYNEAHARGEDIPFHHFVRFHPAVNSNVGGSRSSGKSRHVDDDTLTKLQLLFPWMSIEDLKKMLLTSLKPTSGSSTHPTSRSGTHQTSGSGSHEVVDVDESVVAAVAAQAEEMKEQLDEAQEEDLYFKVRILGGRWSAEQFGVAAQDIGAFSKNREVDIWCSAVGWPKAKSWRISKYGHDNCHALASECARRGNFWMRLWVTEGSPAPFNFEPRAGTYVADQAFSEWFDGLPIGSALFKAAMELRDIVPRPVPA